MQEKPRTEVISITQFLIQNKWKVIMILIAITTFSMCLLPIGILTKEIIDESIPNGNRQSLLKHTTLIFTLIIVHLLGTVTVRNFTLKFTKQYILQLRMKLCENVLGLSRKKTEHNRISETQFRIVNHVERIDILVNGLILTVIPALVMTAGLMLILFVINVKLAMLVIISIPILGVILYLNKRTGASKISAYFKSYEAFNHSVLGTLRGIFLIQDEVLENSTLQGLNEDATNLKESGYQVGAYHATIQHVQEALIAIIGIGVLVAGAFLTFNDEMTLGGLLGFYFVVFIIRRYFNDLIKSIPAMQEGLISHRHIFGKIEAPVTIKTSQVFQESIETIRLENVDFWYDPEKAILQDINIQFEKGKTYLITGENGSGKTSLFHLLTLSYAPEKGAVLINDHELIDPRQVRLKMGILPQDPTFFESSIKENILLNREIDEVIFKNATSFANVNSFIKEMPQQYDTLMGDSGVFLSGGQKQKIALARTLVKEPDFLLLDEPTNHLDKSSIKHLISTLSSLSDPPGIIIISHDESIKTLADVTLHISEHQLNEIES